MSLTAKILLWTAIIECILASPIAWGIVQYMRGGERKRIAEARANVELNKQDKARGRRVQTKAL